MKNIFIVGLGRVFSGLTALLVMSLLTRYAAEESLALYSYIFVLTVTLTIFCQLGFPQSIIRILIKYGSEGKERVGASLAFKMMAWICLASTIVVCLVWLLFKFELIGDHGVTNQPGGFLLILAWLIFISLQSFVGELCRAKNNVIYATIFGGLLSNVLLLLLLTAGVVLKRLEAIDVLLYVNLSLFLSVFSSIIVISRCDWLKFGGSLVIDKGVRVESFQNMTVVAASTIVMQSAAIIIGAYGGAVDIVAYTVAARLVGVFSLLNVIFSQSYSTKLAVLAVARDYAGLQAQATKIARLMFFCVALPATLLMANADTVLLLAYGKIYLNAKTYLYIGCLSMVLISVTGLRSQILIYLGYASELSRISMVAAVVSIIAGFFAFYCFDVQMVVVFCSVVLIGLASAEAVFLYMKTSIASLPIKVIRNA